MSLLTFLALCLWILQNWGLDHDLSTKQSADIVAFTALLEQKLLPALVSSNNCDMC